MGVGDGGVKHQLHHQRRVVQSWAQQSKNFITCLHLSKKQGFFRSLQKENITVKFLARAEQSVLVLGQLGQHAAHPVLVVLVAVVHRLGSSRVNGYCIVQREAFINQSPYS